MEIGQTLQEFVGAFVSRLYTAPIEVNTLQKPQTSVSKVPGILESTLTSINSCYGSEVD